MRVVETKVVTALICWLATSLLTACEAGVGNCPSWPAGVLRGIDYADWTPEGYASESSYDSIRDLSRSGASDVAIVVTAYLENLDDSTVEELAERTSTPSSVRTAAGWAHAAGLGVSLKLHVDVLGGDYRGMITPDDPNIWFSTYREFVLRWAALAAEEGFASIWIGTELETMTPYIDRWAELIDEVREIFDGPVVYAASWSDIRREPTLALAGLVDQIGVDAYFPVADWPDSTVTDMLARWQPWLLELEELERATGRPVLITEIGCPSRRNGPISPWDYRSESPIDMEAQARYYEAALLALSSTPVVTGVFFWAWGLGPGGELDGRHTPRGKPSAEVLRCFWGGR